MTYTEFILGFIAMTLLFMSVSVSNISARLKRHFPTEAEQDREMRAN